MMDSVEQFKNVRHKHEQFTNKLYALVLELLTMNEINFDIVDKRTKTTESFQEKINLKNQKYSDPLKEVTDLSGIRIILYYQDEIERVILLLKKEFKIDNDNSNYKPNNQNPNHFGYNPTHLIIQLSDSRAKLSEWAPFSEFKAEIQIRTVLQHAWGAVSRALYYKSKEDIPIKLQRQLFRLAGLFELADEEFLSIRDKHNALREKVNKISNIEDAILGIDLVSIEKYVTESKLVQNLFFVALQKGFADVLKLKKQSTKDEYSHLISLCNLLGIKNIDQLHNNLTNAFRGAELFFSQLLEQNSKLHESRVYDSWYVDKSFVIMLLLVKEFHAIIKAEDLMEIKWSEETAKLVIGCAKDLP